MIIDASAIVAILFDEPEAFVCADAISRAPVRRISAATFLEAAIVMDGSGDPVAGRRLDELLEAAGIEIEPVTVEQARVGREAYRDFGRGSGNPAQLNFGDCFSYALARTTGEPLLYKGQDFGHTGIASALDPNY